MTIEFEMDGDQLYASDGKAYQASVLTNGNRTANKRILAVGALHPGNDKPEITTAAQVDADEFMKGARAYWGIGMANGLTTDAALRGFACAQQNAANEIHLLEATLTAMRQDKPEPVVGWDDGRSADGRPSDTADRNEERTQRIRNQARYATTPEELRMALDAAILYDPAEFDNLNAVYGMKFLPSKTSPSPRLPQPETTGEVVEVGE